MKLKKALLLLPLFAIFSCKSAEKTENPSHADLLNEFINHSTNVFAGSANASDVVNLLELSGAAYDSSLHNDVSRAESYLSHPVIAAANLGIYTADIAYHIAYDSRDSAFSSYTGARILANDLGFGPFYVEKIWKQYEEGLTDADSILHHMDQYLAQADSNYTDTTRRAILGAFLVGNFIEKQYILHSTLNQALDDPEKSNEEQLRLKEFAVIVIKQQSRLKELIEYVEKYRESDKPGPFSKELKIASVLYTEFGFDEDLSQVSFDEFLASDKLKRLSHQVFRMRKSLVDPLN